MKAAVACWLAKGRGHGTRHNPDNTTQHNGGLQACRRNARPLDLLVPSEMSFRSAATSSVVRSGVLGRFFWRNTTPGSCAGCHLAYLLCSRARAVHESSQGLRSRRPNSTVYLPDLFFFRGDGRELPSLTGIPSLATESHSTSIIASPSRDAGNSRKRQRHAEAPPNASFISCLRSTIVAYSGRYWTSLGTEVGSLPQSYYCICL